MKNIAISINKDYINSVVLSHPGQQHSFQTATALKKSNMLNKYCTTVYLKNKSLTKKLTKYLNGNDIEKTKLRKCDILNDVDVYQKFHV